MASLCAFIRDHRSLAALLIALALGMKLLVPSGYMVSGGASLTITICGGGDQAAATRLLSIVKPGQRGEPSGEDHGKADGVCPYSALAMAAVSGADVPLLVLALAFILALGFAPAELPRLRARGFLRPPLRGPPLAA